MTTQVTLIVSLLDLLGGACKLTLIKNSVPAVYKSSVATSAVYCFMTALMYFYMNYKNGFFSDILKVRRYPTMICYIDWISTTTLIILKFLQLLGNDSKGSGIATMLIEADVIMILFRYNW